MDLHDKRIAVIGLGYVGLPLAIEFGKKYKVLGFDINQSRIEELNLLTDRTKEADLVGMKNAMELAKSHLGYGLNFSAKIEDLKNYNVFIITVPTPIDQFKAPDLTPLLKATEMLGKVIKKEDIVIYESTVYPGCTEDDCVPVLEKFSGLKFNQDFFCGYSPERINPGDKINTLTKIKKVTSGSTPEIAEVVDQLYPLSLQAHTRRQVLK
jgi:UDP-N-acetyl-D-glucosamine/UDP-N-acetyl-D-galactosamine dehydrogenase